MYKIGIDLGATKIHAVLVKDGKIIKNYRTETGKGIGVGLSHIKDAVDDLIFLVPKSEIKGIGVGAPGPMNYKKILC
jgi:predicted NBD/HSP70 family sugar kinase